MPNHLLRKFIAFAIFWLLFALLFVGITLSITWRLEDRGMAINEAGSLRKQTYLMVALVQAGDTQNLPHAINEFESKMQDLARLKNGSLGSEIQNQYLQQLNTVQAGFVSFKTQILAVQNESSIPSDLLLETQTFVNSINELVKSIELENTRSIQNMRKAQFLLMFMMFITALMVLLLLNQFLIKPLLGLQEGISRLKAQLFDAKTHTTAEPERYEVATEFNRIVSHLQADNQAIGTQLHCKEEAINQMNQRVLAFTKISQELALVTPNQLWMEQWLKQVLAGLSQAAGSIRILTREGTSMRWACHVNIREELREDHSYFQRLQLQSHLTSPNQADSANGLNYRIIEVDNNEEIIFPIQYQHTVHGWLTLFPAVGTAICQQEEWLIKNACVQLAMKLELEA